MSNESIQRDRAGGKPVRSHRADGPSERVPTLPEERA
jgi:hypothetical protein